MSFIKDGIMQYEGKEPILPHPVDYFKQRQMFVDCRGTLEIHPSAMFGFNIYIYTQSHALSGEPRVVDRPVIIEGKTFIGSSSIIYNSTIKQCSIVAVGTVVRSQIVPEYTIVAGNPARIIAKFNQDAAQWVYLKEPERLISKIERGN